MWINGFYQSSLLLNEALRLASLRLRFVNGLCWWMMCRRGWRRLMTFHIQIRWSDLNYTTSASCLLVRLAGVVQCDRWLLCGTLVKKQAAAVMNLFVQSRRSSRAVKVQHCPAATRLPLIKQNIKNCRDPKNWLLNSFLHTRASLHSNIAQQSRSKSITTEDQSNIKIEAFHRPETPWRLLFHLNFNVLRSRRVPVCREDRAARHSDIWES